MRGNFIACVGFSLRQEGGLSSTPGDAGGVTNFGISQAAYPHLDIAALTVYDAMKLYEQDYWTNIAGDSLPLGLDLMALDFAINAGPGEAAKRLQGLLGVAQDGEIGTVTLAAIAKGTPSGLIVQYAYSREAFYKRLDGFAEFGAGWTRRAQRCQTMALAMVQVG